eukprot:1217619-Pyramimonas_sp.AAC.1
MCSVLAELEAAREALSDHIQLAQSLTKMVNNLRSNINKQQQQFHRFASESRIVGKADYFAIMTRSERIKKLEEDARGAKDVSDQLEKKLDIMAALQVRQSGKQIISLFEIFQLRLAEEEQKL